MNTLFFINLLWKSTLILSLLISLSYLARKVSAITRYHMMRIGFLGLLVLPLVIFVFPSVKISFYSLKNDNFSLYSAPDPSKDYFSSGETMSSDFHNKMLPSETKPPIHFPQNSEVFLSFPPPFDTTSLSTWEFYLNIFWGILFIGGILRTYLAIEKVHRLVNSSQKPLDPKGKWSHMLFSLKSRLKIRQPVQLRISEQVQIPMAAGLSKPVILLPTHSEEWLEEEKEMILLHELIHIQHKDYLFNGLISLVQAVYWFHPLVWWATYLYQKEQELACDERLLSQGYDPVRYAEHLLCAAWKVNFSITQNFAPTFSLKQSSTFSQRIESILNFQEDGYKHSPLKLIGLSLIIFCLAGCFQLGEKSELSGREAPTTYLLPQQLAQGSVEAQLKAIWALGEAERTEAAPLLIPLLNHENPEIRGVAAWALGEIKHPQSLDPLVDALDESDLYAKEMIIRSIGEFESVSTISLLAKTLQDPHTSIRTAGIWSLGEIASQETIPLIQKGTQDASPEVRQAAINVLGYRLFPTCLPSLVQSLQDENHTVRMSAIRTLAHYPSADAINGLVGILDDPHPEIRREAVIALSKIGDSEVIQTLIPMMRDPSHAVREEVINALDEINI